MKGRLLILLASVIAFDFFVTMLGQPASYWHNAHTANEGNALFRWVMYQGPPCYFAFVVMYGAGVVSLVSRLPRRPAVLVGMVFMLSHYFAASTWLAFHFNLSMAGPAAYALVLSIAVLSTMRHSDREIC